MKAKLFGFVLLTLPLVLFAHDEHKSISLSSHSVASNISISHIPVTRALVIGISNYQDTLIPDLNYADKDADNFARFLHAPNGGNIPSEQIMVLLNEKATYGQVFKGLEWLLDETEEGDSVIIYFSGHGNAHANLINQLGILLLYNTPSEICAINSLKVNDLQEYITSLSVTKKAQVWVIVDACRAGKLKWSEVYGPTLMNANRIQQWSNETKILSCQEDEYSIEGRQWGGGRGVFSFYLVNGLIGKADADRDNTVSLLEIGRYLEDHVSNDVEPLHQNPFTLGDKITVLSHVDQQLLHQLDSNERGFVLPAFEPVEPRGLEQEALEHADSSILQLYAAYLKAIDEKRLLEPVNDCADYYFTKLMQIDTIRLLHPVLRRNFAASLIDDGQQVVNKYLKTDRQTVRNVWGSIPEYVRLPAYYHRAAEILEENNYMYKDLKVKEYYFLANAIRKFRFPDSTDERVFTEKKRLLDEALLLDSTSALVYEGLAQIYFNVDQMETIKYLLKASELAPHWALLYYYLGAYFNYSDPQRSIDYYKKAIAIDSTFIRSYNWIAVPYGILGDQDSGIYWRRLYVDKFIQLYMLDTTNINAYDFNDIGSALWQLKDYTRAKEFLLKGDHLLTKELGGNIFLFLTYVDLLEFDNAISMSEKSINDTDNKNLLYGYIGAIYFLFKHDIEKAFQEFEKLGIGVDKPYSPKINLDSYSFLLDIYWRADSINNAYTMAKKLIEGNPNRPVNKFLAGELALRLGKLDTSNLYFMQVVEIRDAKVRRNDIFQPPYVCKAIACHRLGKMDQFHQLLDTVQAQLPNDPWRYFYFALIFANTNNEQAAIDALNKAIALGWQPNHLMWIHGTLCDYLLDPIRETDGFKQLVQKYFPQYYTIATQLPRRQ